MKKQKGFSLLQLMIVIAVSTTIVASAMILYRDSINSADLKDLMYNLSSMNLAMRDMFQRGGTENFDTRLARTANIVPSAMSFEDGKLYNVFGGEVRIMGRTNPNTATSLVGIRSFEIQYEYVPQELCSDILNNQLKSNWTAFGVTSGENSPVAADTRIYSSDGTANNFSEGGEVLRETEIIKLCSIDSSRVNMTFIYDTDI